MDEPKEFDAVREYVTVTPEDGKVRISLNDSEAPEETEPDTAETEPTPAPEGSN